VSPAKFSSRVAFWSSIQGDAVESEVDQLLVAGQKAESKFSQLIEQQGESIMNRYLVEMQLAPQAFTAFVKNPGDRQQANIAVVESVGGTFINYWFAVGSNTIYLVVEAPDGTKMEALTMASLAGGVVTNVKTVQILTASEAVAAMEMAGNTGYRAPASQ